MNPTMLKLASELLKMAADEFSNHGCNDFELDDTPENRELIINMQTEGGWDDPKEVRVHDGKIFTTDWGLMRYLAKKLATIAGGSWAS
jgi:hypothetical protein